MTPRRLSAIPESPWWLDLCAAAACAYLAWSLLGAHPVKALVGAWLAGACTMTALVKLLERIEVGHGG